MINNVFIINPIRSGYIAKCLKTLYDYTDMSQNRVIVVDQTLNGLTLANLPKIHLYLRPHRNLGFSKSMNEGIIHGRHWGAKYITCMNDDVCFINTRWWSGIEETFAQDEKIMAVNPMSPREPGWGYGLPHGEYLDLLPYKEEYTEQEYGWLLAGDFAQIKKEKGFPASFPDQKRGVIDAIATWCTVFKREFFDKFGLFEERFYPGGGEDYSLDARCYRESYRMVGTTRSWVWHHWGSSKDKPGESGDEGLPIIDSLRWNNADELWPPELNLSWDEKQQKMVPKSMDPWGKVTMPDGSKKPMVRVGEIGVVDI